MSIHSQNDAVILEFGLKKPAFRICVNTPTTHGSIGLTTGLDPAMTLGCGGYGGNITSDNITPRHLLNVKRLAYELRPASTGRTAPPPVTPLPKVASPPASPGLSASEVTAHVEAFLGGRRPVPVGPPATAPTEEEALFVCEDDVRQAIAQGRRILIGDRTIITPLARDLGEAHKVLVEGRWPTPTGR
jgi:acetaldehyde dehydrogenase (acetylating)